MAKCKSLSPLRLHSFGGPRPYAQTGRGPCHRIAIFNNITPRLLPRLPHITVTHLQETYLSEDVIRCCLEAFWETN